MRIILYSRHFLPIFFRRCKHASLTFCLLDNGLFRFMGKHLAKGGKCVFTSLLWIQPTCSRFLLLFLYSQPTRRGSIIEWKKGKRSQAQCIVKENLCDMLLRNISNETNVCISSNEAYISHILAPNHQEWATMHIAFATIPGMICTITHACTQTLSI